VAVLQVINAVLIFIIANYVYGDNIYLFVGSNEVCAIRQDEIDRSDDEDEPAELMKQPKNVSNNYYVILLAKPTFCDPITTPKVLNN